MSASQGALRRIAARRRRHGGSQPALEPDALRDLVAAAQARERGGREELIEAVAPLIGSVARIYRGCAAVSREELMQAGFVGLLRALDRFEPERGTPFWAYASWWVRQAMQQLVSELARPVVLSDRALRQLARIKDADREHLQRCAREPSCAELATRAGLRSEQVEQLIATDRRPRALEQLLNSNEDAGGTFGERLADPVAEDAYERIPAKVESDRLRTLLQALDARERTIVSAHFGLDGPERSLRQVGATLGVSGERVRQVERVALEKLREAALTGAVDNSRPTPCKAGQHRTTKHEMSSNRQDPSPPATGGRSERRLSLRSAGAGRPFPLPR
jgi:RNA polymerase primary sigma factor